MYSVPLKKKKNQDNEKAVSTVLKTQRRTSTVQYRNVINVTRACRLCVYKLYILYNIIHYIVIYYVRIYLYVACSGKNKNKNIIKCHIIILWVVVIIIIINYSVHALVEEGVSFTSNAFVLHFNTFL